MNVTARLRAPCHRGGVGRSNFIAILEIRYFVSGTWARSDCITFFMRIRMGEIRSGAVGVVFRAWRDTDVLSWYVDIDRS